MMDQQKILTEMARQKTIDAINMVDASLESIKPYQTDKVYAPKEREPYDALSDRFIRAVEISIKFFRSYEKYEYGENSETIRDLLNRMEKLSIISSVMLWMRMRDVRNRIVDDYLPEQIKDMYDLITGEFGAELKRLSESLHSNSEEGK